MIVGRMTIEGAPHLRAEHYAGVRLRQPLRQDRPALPRADVAREDDGGGAAVPVGRDLEDGQPAERGHASKRCSEIYEEGWKLGLKAVALYRDGCKASQPLSTSSDEEERRASRRREPPQPCGDVAGRGRRRRTMRRCAPTGTRVRLPQEAPRLHAGGARRRAQGLPAHRRVRGRHARRDLHRHAQGGRRLPLADELLRDGGLGRACSTACRSRPSSSSSRSRASSRTASVEGHPNIKFATSIVDYIFRVLGVEYLRRYDFAHVKPAEEAAPIEDPTAPRLVASGEVRLSEPAPPASQPPARDRRRDRGATRRTARSTRSSKR